MEDHRHVDERWQPQTETAEPHVSSKGTRGARGARGSVRSSETARCCQDPRETSPILPPYVRVKWLKNVRPRRRCWRCPPSFSSTPANLPYSVNFSAGT